MGTPDWGDSFTIFFALKRIFMYRLLHDLTLYLRKVGFVCRRYTNKVFRVVLFVMVVLFVIYSVMA